jgi:hypothetical protein
MSLRLTPADLPPKTDRGGLTPGLPPRWADSGRLLERPVFGALWAVFDAWRQQVTQAPGNALPVFCLCGRAGDGKSALLLQLAAAVLRREVVSALRLWEASEDPRRFETPPTGDGAWHFVDRLPELIHGPIGEEWLRRLRETQPCFVVTTASPAALEWFTQKHPKRFALTLWSLPPLSSQEAAGLAAGFGAVGPAPVWQAGMTLETFLFALRQGRGLDERVVAQAVELPQVVCAANLLGLAVPGSLLKRKPPGALSPAGPDWLPTRLDADGLRLVTPGLAQPLFEVWYPDVESRWFQVADGFARLLEIWLREKQAAAASWFLRRLLYTEHLSRVLSARGHPVDLRDLRKDIMRELYRRHRAAHAKLPVASLLSAWMEIGQAFRLRPDVMEDAVGVLEQMPEAVPPALAADIWLHSELRKNPLAGKLRRKVADFFTGTNADAGAALTRLYTETRQYDAALPVLQFWLEKQCAHPHFNAVFRVLLETPHGRGTIHNWAHECLGWHWQGRAAAKPLGLLLQNNPQSQLLRQFAHDWLPANASLPEAGQVLVGLLGSDDPDPTAVQTALLWTTHHPVHPAAGELWEVLLRYHAGETAVRQVALEWIKTCPQHPQAPAMLLGIVRLEVHNPAFAATVQGWLAAQPAHEQAPELLEALATSTDAAIRKILAHWLDHNGGHPAAARLLTTILSAGKISPDWRRRAESFLRKGHPEAFRVLRVLLAGTDSDRALALAREHLPRVGLAEQKELCHWLGRLAGHQPERVVVLRHGLPGQPELTEAFFRSLRETLWEMPADPLNEWIKTGLVRLDESDQQWIFQRLLEQATPLPAPLGAALAAWLQRNVKLPAYNAMVQTLRQHPKQGRYFHSVSLLPLKILADVCAPA